MAVNGDRSYCCYSYSQLVDMLPLGLPQGLEAPVMGAVNGVMFLFFCMLPMNGKMDEQC